MEYVVHIIVITAIFCVLALSLDLLVGQLGMFSLCHAAFFGIGAYSSALLVERMGFPIWVSLLGALVVTGMLSLVIALPTAHLKEDLFAIATFGFQMIAYSLMINWKSVTGGPSGIGGISSFGSLLEGRGSRILAAAAICLVLAVVVLLIYRRITISQFGRVLRSIREDEVFTLASGKNVRSAKLQTFIFSAALAGLAGSVYSHYTTYISPSSFTIMDSILIISMIIIGGRGTMWGPVLGSAILMAFPELLRFLGISGSAAANVRQIIYGLLLVLVVIFRPHGLVGKPRLGRI